MEEEVDEEKEWRRAEGREGEGEEGAETACSWKSFASRASVTLYRSRILFACPPSRPQLSAHLPARPANPASTSAVVSLARAASTSHAAH
eukprot:795447-Rhodomonas_salina.2